MRIFMAVTLLAVGAAALASAQQRPDFSGTWVATKDVPQGIEAAPSPIFGPRFAIKQDASAVTILRVGRDGPMGVALPIDGTEVTWRAAANNCVGDSARTEKIAFEGGGMVYTLVSTAAAGAGATPPRVINVRYPIRMDGDKLVVQGSVVRQGQPHPVATVYARSTEPMEATPVPVFKGAAATIAQAEWIATTWTGSVGTGASQSSVEERWTPAASGAMLGIGRTVRGTTLASFEFLCIVERNGTLVYQAMPNARMPATNFTLTSVTADSLTFENPAHDYPKLVRYTRMPDGSLQTTISAGGETRAQSVVLRKIQ